jgi:hypothetical protein
MQLCQPVGYDINMADRATGEAPPEEGQNEALLNAFKPLKIRNYRMNFHELHKVGGGGCIKPTETNLLSAHTCQRGLLFRELTAKCIDCHSESLLKY